ncbi:MAG: hypothetical protein GY820_25150, partial [Gammaproteobacteria bacterium]|nr:hypothetical protein [Gammaproteobacteria bacterium]
MCVAPQEEYMEWRQLCFPDIGRKREQTNAELAARMRRHGTQQQHASSSSSRHSLPQAHGATHPLSMVCKW